jgi:hypothetical protein
VKALRWRCDKCNECVATFEDGWWRPTTDFGGVGSRRSEKRAALRRGYYEDVVKYDPEDRQYFPDKAPPEQLAARPLAGLPRDGVLYGLCPVHGTRKVRLADVRHKLSR